jgi:quinoprotein glucose dehydrogenase
MDGPPPHARLTDGADADDRLRDGNYRKGVPGKAGHRVSQLVKSTMKIHSIVAVLVLFSVPAERAAAQKQNTGWKDYLGGPDGSHYSPLTQINASNVSTLEVAWSYPSPDGTSVFCPLVVDNIAYVAAKGGALVALDATKGKELWAHPFGTGGGGRGGISGQRGANYWESKDRKDRRILVTSSGYLHAIDALTGKTIESFADHGKLDLKIGIDRAPIPLASRTPGRIFENLIILGSFPGEGYLAPPGDLRTFDVRTGKLAWVFHTVPRPGELGYDTWPKDAYKYMGGVDVWCEITVDEKRGIAYFPISSPKYELYGGDRPGNNLFADCLLALDARTGKYLWHFQTVHHDIWDYDPTAAPQLVTVKHDGKTVDVVALASKNGFLYVFDRVTGKPLWPIEERPVPKSEVPGEWTSPTQPFPIMPPPFARQRMTKDDLYWLYDSGGEDALGGALRERAEQGPVHTDRSDRYHFDTRRQRRPVLLGHGSGSRQRDCVRRVEGLPLDLENGKGRGIDCVEFRRHHPEPHSAGRRAWARRIRHDGWAAHGAAIWPHDL